MQKLGRFHILISVLNFFQMMGVIPKSDRWPGQVVHIAERAQAGGVQEKESSGSGFDPKPAGREHSQKMAARENQHVAIDRTQMSYHFIRARADFSRRFSVRAAVAKQFPRRIALVYFRCSTSFVITIVPFKQIRICRGPGSEPGQFARARGTLQWAREHFRESDPCESFAEAL